MHTGQAIVWSERLPKAFLVQKDFLVLPVYHTSSYRNDFFFSSLYSTYTLFNTLEIWVVRGERWGCFRSFSSSAVSLHSSRDGEHLTRAFAQLLPRLPDKGGGVRSLQRSCRVLFWALRLCPGLRRREPMSIPFLHWTDPSKWHWHSYWCDGLIFHYICKSGNYLLVCNRMHIFCMDNSENCASGVKC